MGENMEGVESSSPYREALISLIVSISRATRLRESNQVLLVMQLDTEAKIREFSRWIKSKLKGENDLQVDEIQIMHASARISRGEKPE